MRITVLTAALAVLAVPATAAETITELNNPALNSSYTAPTIGTGPQSQAFDAPGLEAYAFAAYGVNKVRAWADTPDGSSAIFSANATSEWRDTISFTAASDGFADFFIHVEESLLAGGGISTGSFQYAFNASSASDSTSLILGHQRQWLAPPQPIFDRSVVSRDGVAVQVPSLPKVLALTVAFKPGEEIALSSKMFCYAASRATPGGCDASHSAYWGGVTRVVDANGDAMAWALTSESGTDYSGSFVPEPGTWALLLLGFGVVGGALRAGRGARTLARS